MIERQGKQFVLYAGLLDEAHRSGLKAIRTKLVQAPAPENGNVCICYAEVETEKGVFSGIGDASADNVGRNIAVHFIRMAETRAKARALRDAINVGAAAVEELGDLDDDRESAFEPPARAAQRGFLPPNGGDEPTVARNAPRAPTPIGAGETATPAQVRAIYAIGRDQLGLSDEAIDERSMGLYQRRPAELSKRQASHLITTLKPAS
jgi:hypothetical protein